MELKTFHSLKTLIRAADRLVKGCDTVSFDLFDTLFIRRIHDPDMVKPAVARFIAQKAAACGYHWTWEEVQSLRDTYEQAQRAETGKKFDDHEARYPDYMTKALSTVFKEKMTADILEAVTDYELGLEMAMIVPRKDLVAWIKKIYSHGKKILIVSDIYLPASHLKRLVDHFKLTPFVVDVISSADTFLAKASGKAFPLLIDKFALDVDRWLHIGDNPISDGLRPLENGIQALVLEDRSEKHRKTLARMYATFANARPFWKGRLLHQLALPLEKENQPRDPLYVEGYNFLAPLVGAFTQGVFERTRKKDIDRIYFFSREGLTFKKFWDSAIPFIAPPEALPDTRYLYVSRMALAGASCAYHGLPQTKADIAFLPPGNRDMRDFCRVFSLDIKPLLPIMKKYKIDEKAPVSPVHAAAADKSGTPKNFNYKFRLLIEDIDFQLEIKKQTKPYNDALQRYLEKEHFFDQPEVALVDVGWMGTIQRFLYDAVKHRDDKPVFNGYLFAVSRGTPYPTMADNHVEGILYDRNQFDFAASTIMYNRDLFEEAFRAPHPTMAAYRLTDDDVDLVFRTTEDAIGKAEAMQDSYFAPLQQGLFDAAPRYGAAMAILGYPLDELMPWVRYLLVSKLAFPRARELTLLKHQYHVDDIHGTHKLPKKFWKTQRHLWDRSASSLKWNPFIKLIYYLKKARPT